MRHGFQLAELVIVLALISGPVLISMNLSQASVRNTQMVQERTAARMCLVDIAELLQGESIERLRTLSADAASQVAELQETRLDQLPENVQEQYRRQLGNLGTSLKVTLQESLGPGSGLASLKVAVRLRQGAEVSVCRLFRPISRPATN
jgi:Tfp pilus assembly protein PilE